MNMKITGIGTVGAGEYDKVSIRGIGQLTGDVRCSILDSVGAVSGNGKIECLDSISCDGSATFKDIVQSKCINCTGSVRFEKDCIDIEKISIDGSAKFLSSLKAQIVQLSGYSYLEKDIEAEEIYIIGDSQIYGLMSAKQVKIEFENSLEVNKIGGTNIIILQKEKGMNKIKNAPIFKKIWGPSIAVIDTIEGEQIAVEFAEVSKIIGKSVAIGRNCKIKLVQYTDEIEIDSSSIVEQCEKIV